MPESVATPRGASTHHSFRLNGQTVAQYNDGADMPPGLSPRPYLHPVTTLAGTAVTEVQPADHLHHYGVSLAVPDVDGTSYWGGSTYVRGSGSTILQNHGRQVRLAPLEVDGPSIRENLEWREPEGNPQLREERTILASALDDFTWVLHWNSVLHAVAGEVSLGSPATNGKPGGFYGGFFWRAPCGSNDVLAIVAEGCGESIAHGSTSPWLALTTATCSIVLVQQGEIRPWFVRTASYPGAGPAFAVDERRIVSPGVPLEQRMTVAVSDRGDLRVAGAAEIAEQLRATTL